MPTLADLQKRCTIDPIHGCWLWKGCVQGNGYARARHNGKTWFVHRLAYVLKHGSVAPGVDVYWTCKGPRHCIHPDHHAAGDRLDTMRSVKDRDRIASGIRLGVKRRGERSHFAKLDWAAVRDIRARLNKMDDKQEIAAAFGVTPSNLDRIARYDTWKEGFAA